MTFFPRFCGWCACPAIHFCAEFTHPWAILSSPPEMLASRLFPGGSADAVPYRHAGAMRVERGGVAPITVETGDVVVFARGIQHVLASKAGLAPVPIQDIYRPSAGRISVLQHGGGGEESRFICGFLHSDRRFGPLLDAMPTLTCMRVREGAIVLEAYTDIDRYADPVRLDEPAGWWQAAVAHLVGEATRSGPDGPPPRVDATSHRAR